MVAAALAGCSADPYKGRTPAPPDRLVTPVQNTAAQSKPEAAGTVPQGDGSEKVAPTDSGYFPRVSGNR
jgi:hypothetical protein